MVFIDLPDYIEHKAVADALVPVLGPVVSAGFVSDAGECFGHSEGLHVGAHKGDTTLRRMLMKTTVAT